MRNLFRMALEDDDSENAGGTAEKTIVMKGPLAEIYTKALDVVYAKNDPVTGKPAVESQMQEITLLQNLAHSPAPEENTNPSFMTVYGVSKDAIQEGNVVEVTNELANTPEDRRDDFIVIIDGTQPGPNSESSGVPQEQLLRLNAAMESTVLALGGKLYRSLEEFTAAQD